MHTYIHMYACYQFVCSIDVSLIIQVLPVPALSMFANSVCYFRYTCHLPIPVWRCLGHVRAVHSPETLRIFIKLPNRRCLEKQPLRCSCKLWESFLGTGAGLLGLICWHWGWHRTAIWNGSTEQDTPDCGTAGAYASHPCQHGASSRFLAVATPQA